MSSLPSELPPTITKRGSRTDREPGTRWIDSDLRLFCMYVALYPSVRFFFFFLFCESLRLTFYVVSLRLTFTAPDNLALNAFDSCLPCVTIRWQCTNLDQLTKYLLTSVFFTNWIRDCIVHHRTILDVLAFCVGPNTCPYPQSIVLHKRSLQESMIALLFL